MKNFALLLSAMAVASSAFAVTPEVNKSLVKTSKAAVEPVQVSAYECTGDKVRVANPVVGKKVISNVPTRADELSVSYVEPDGLFALGLNEQRQSLGGYSLRKGPAYTPLTWTNTSVGATEFEWEIITNYQTNETEIFKTTDYTNAESWSIVDGPVLYGMDAAGNADLFQMGASKTEEGELEEPTIGYFFGGNCVYSQTNLGMTTYLYDNNGHGFTRFSIFAYDPSAKDNDPATGLDPIFTTPDPDGYGFENVKFKGYMNAFKQPAAPYMITKMWTWLNIKANKATNVELTLYKIGEDGKVSDEILAAGEAAVAPSAEAVSTMVSFDLFALDEDGLQTEDLIVIDCPVAVYMTFNVEDIDQVNSVCGAGARYKANANSPYPRNAFILLDVEGDVIYIPSPYSYFADNTRTELIAPTDFMWMMDATFPWAVVADGVSEIQAPKEGGTVSFNINAMYDIKYFGYNLPEDCDWIDLETAEVTFNDETQIQTLHLPVAPLPEGVEGRSAKIEVVGPATELILYVTQGEGSAVSTIVVDKNAEYYDLAGRRVANPEKGIYIKKTGNKAEKVLF